MAISTGDILLVDIIGDNDGGDDITNSYQLQHVGGSSISDAQGLVDLLEWAEALLLILNDILNAVTKWRKIKVFNKTQAKIVGEANIVTNIAGTLTNDPLPSGAAYLLSFPTLIPHVRMRKFFGMGDESLCTASGNVAAAALTELLAVGTFLMTSFSGTNSQWLYGYDSPKALAFVVPSSAVATNIWAYQRRRRQGTGS